MPADYRGIPTSVCPCGCNVFKIVAQLDDDHQIAAYSLNGYCFGCGAAVTIPTPKEVNDGLL